MTEKLSSFERLGKIMMDDIDAFDRQGVSPESPKPAKTISDFAELRPKKKKKKDKVGITMNVGDTVYAVIRYVGKKMLRWKLQYDKEATNWDVYWTDCAVQAETLGKMQPYQKINHFPGMYSLARKNHLGRNLMKMAKQFPDSYKFFPKTWLLPAEFGDFKSQFQKGKLRTFIVKPEASCQGRGIFLTRDIDDVSPSEHYVAQRYLTNPYLIDDLKFDLRIYVLLAGCDPLRIYIYKEGLARFATEEYEAPNRDNMDNVCMHLTNYAINKDNENFVFNEDDQDMSKGHKRSLTSVFELLRSQKQGEDVDKLWKSIKQIMIKTFCAVQPILCHHYKSCQPDNFINNMCFEVLGMDVILNHKLKPFLLEVNHTPSFTTDTPLDSHIKRNLINDALKLMNVSVKQRNEIINERKEQMQQRVLTGKKNKISPRGKQEIISKLQRVRDEWEHNHLGNYEIVYPTQTAEDEQYLPYLEHARKLYEEQTGAHIRRNTKKQSSIAPQQQLSNQSHISNVSQQQQPKPQQLPQPKNSKSQDLEKIYAVKPKPRSVEKKTQPIMRPNDTSEGTLDSPVRMHRIESRGSDLKPQPVIKKRAVPNIKYRDLVCVMNEDEPSLQDKYTWYLRQQKERQLQQFTGSELVRDCDSPYDEQQQQYTKKIFSSSSHKSGEDQFNAKVGYQTRLLQQQQQGLSNQHGNYLTPKLFQLQGINAKTETKLGEIRLKKFI